MQQISAASVWGNLAGLNTLGPQYLALYLQLLQQTASSGNLSTLSGLHPMGGKCFTAVEERQQPGHEAQPTAV